MFSSATVLYLLIQIAIAQFPDHVDLEKLGEVDFDNEKYKILRPSLHKVRDHFKDVMMKKKSDLPDLKVLIDKNGFRHYWSTLDETSTRNEVERPVKPVKTTKYETKSKKRKLPLKMPKNEVLKKIKERWLQKKNKLLKTKPLGRHGKKLYHVETKILCPYFGLIRTNHYMDDESVKGI